MSNTGAVHAVASFCFHTRQGQNDFNKTGYGGPMPPPGHGVRHDQFHLYALDVSLLAGPELIKEQLVDAMQGHILVEGELVGTYERT
jgi:phosphatidylethanolamine-binding protein (PEBP) family uncharacterized protein